MIPLVKRSDDSATSYKQTSYGILPRHQLRPLEERALAKGYAFLSERAADVSRGRISPAFILELHRLCFLDLMPQDAGVFRTEQVTYSAKEAPHFSLVPSLIHTLCDDVEYRMAHLPEIEDPVYLVHVIELLAQFHARFVFIHPFKDYNGRTGRLLMNYLCMRLQMPIIEFRTETAADRKRYIDALQQADSGALEALEKLISTSLTESMASNT